MDVIADRRTVLGVVVVAKDGEVWATADGDLCEEGEEVVGDAQWVFAEGARDVGASGVEVAEGGGFPGGVGDAEVFDEVFAGDFGAAVGVCGAAGTDFYKVSGKDNWGATRDGDHVGETRCVAVYCC